MARKRAQRRDDGWPRLPVRLPGNPWVNFVVRYCIGVAVAAATWQYFGWHIELAYLALVAVLGFFQWRNTRRFVLLSRPLPPAPEDAEDDETWPPQRPDTR
jgi:hypothetical protein